MFKKIFLALALFTAPLAGAVEPSAPVAVESVAGVESATETTLSTASSPVTEIHSDSQAADAVGQMMEAGRSGKWNLVAALVLMLLVYGLKKKGMLNKVPAEHIPTVTLALGLASGLIPQLIAANPDWLMGIVSGVGSGLGASGLWEVAGKRALVKKVVVAPVVEVVAEVPAPPVEVPAPAPEKPAKKASGKKPGRKKKA
jgi:hypothetical protein